MGGCLSADKTAFRQLDRGNKGYLTLDDLARGTSRTPWPTEADCSTAAQADLPEHFFVSPALLFLFDTKRAGRLGMSEFCNLLGHVRAATKPNTFRDAFELLRSNSTVSVAVRKNSHCWKSTLSDTTKGTRRDLSLIVRLQLACMLVLFAFGRDEGRLATAIPGPATASLDALTVSLPLELTQAAFLLFADHLTAEYRSVSVADPHDEAKILGDYKLMETVGYGAEGVVKRAIHQPTGTERAIKVIEKGNVAQMSKVDVQIKAMELLTHPNIIALLQVLESETDIFLVLEHCDQSLYDVVAHRGRGLPEDEIRPLFRRLILAIQYSHSVGVCHRDLRVENLLLTQDGVLKVADFGHAGVFAEGWDMFSTTLVGSVQYISPEQIHGKCYSGQLIDMWACGIILYFLAVGRLPFDSRAHSDNMHAFLDDVLSARYSFPTSVSHDLQNLISRLLMTNAEERATPADVLAHPWMAVDAAIDSSKSESLQE
ncbi:CBL-interacting protein kinase 9 [Capsaspora owczarzaki ATCC 30864]|uniref:CBL-interacting protein kinase 9 n=1 Tax=Capsaspora owczarzaki (strain ATCC 30864) TaxID=595528 RepID=UPI0001FE2A09|nr:CBL-interacting protein kinase 9 [Capsaspora owczarzaki ATCC 30864]|eukprot:XP_004363738.1 CBL-interacting protein kinase 9 [Capsaspora owczarzaki ATCC 30864]